MPGNDLFDQAMKAATAPPPPPMAGTHDVTQDEAGTTIPGGSAPAKASGNQLFDNAMKAATAPPAAPLALPARPSINPAQDYGGATLSQQDLEQLSAQADCSLFTQRVMAKAGIQVPRTAIQQFRATPMVLNQGQKDFSKLKPGDLVFFDNHLRDGFNTAGKAVMGESGVSGYVNHVGIYAGNGQVVHDPGNGTVKETPLSAMASRMTFMGASRPGSAPPSIAVPAGSKPPKAVSRAEFNAAKDRPPLPFSMDEFRAAMREQRDIPLRGNPNSSIKPLYRGKDYIPLADAMAMVSKSTGKTTTEIGTENPGETPTEMEHRQDLEGAPRFHNMLTDHLAGPKMFLHGAAEVTGGIARGIADTVGGQQGALTPEQEKEARHATGAALNSAIPMALTSGSVGGLGGAAIAAAGGIGSGDVSTPEGLALTVSAMGFGALAHGAASLAYKYGVKPVAGLIQKAIANNGATIAEDAAKIGLTSGETQTLKAGVANEKPVESSAGSSQLSVSEPATTPRSFTKPQIAAMGRYQGPKYSYIVGGPDSRAYQLLQARGLIDADGALTADGKQLHAQVHGYEPAPAAVEEPKPGVSPAAEPQSNPIETPKTSPKPDQEPALLNSGIPLGPMLSAWLNKGKGALSKVGVSTGSRIRNMSLENLSGLGEIDPDLRQAAVRVGASRAEAGVLIRKAAPLIDAASGGQWDKVRNVLVESRLQGAAGRWQAMSEALRKMPDDEFGSHYEDTFSDIAGKLGIGKDVDEMLVGGDPAGAREMLADHFADAAGRVKHVMTPEEFTALTNDPQIQAGLAAYKEHIEAPIAASHATNEGVFSDALGPLDTYYPLSPLDEAGQPLKSLRSGSKARPFSRPSNTRNGFATGLSPGYDTSTQALGDSLHAAVRANNKAALMDALESKGLIRTLGQKERGTLPDNPTINIGGVNFDAVQVPIKADRTIITAGGETAHAPGKTALVPEWLATELGPILNSKEVRDPMVSKLLGAVNIFGMSGPVDAVFHTNNLVGSLVTGTPYLKGFLGKTVFNTQLTKKVGALIQIGLTKTSDEAAIRDLGEMARIGALPDKYAGVTTSKALSDLTGAELNRHSFAAFLYGPNGIDARARLLMYRIAKEINPGASGSDLAKMVHQLGAYNRALESTIESSVKRSGLSPFVTAGKTMLVNGVNTWLGRTSMPLTGLNPFQKAGLRVAQQLSGGALGYAGTWMALHHAITGKWPWEDKNARFGKLPVPDGVANTDLGKRLWGEARGQKYVDMRFANPIADRGAAAVGVDQGFDTAQRGGTAAQITDAAITGIVNSVIHPLTSGPAANTIFTGATGLAPHLRSVRGMSLTQVSPDRGGGLAHIKENLLQGAGKANSALGNLADSMGLKDEPYYKKDDGRDPTFESILNLALPGLASNEDIEAREKGVARDAADRARAVRKQQYVPKISADVRRALDQHGIPWAGGFASQQPSEPDAKFALRQEKTDEVVGRATNQLIHTPAWAAEKSATARQMMLQKVVNAAQDAVARAMTGDLKAERGQEKAKQIAGERSGAK